MAGKRNALGKGLTALLKDSKTDVTAKNPVAVNNTSDILLKEIEANPFQPREEFEDEKLEELAQSIKVHGVIQPITVRKVGYGKYQIISGERRTRAAIRAGLESIPAYVRIANDQEMLEMALIENIHRENLNAIEVAISYQRLLDECKLNQEKLADRVGKKRTTVTNYLRLLKLPANIQAGLRDRRISMGHARALISVSDPKLQEKIYNKLINEGLSVRETEKLVQDGAKNSITVKKKTLTAGQSENEDYDIIEKKFTKFYGKKVVVRGGKDGKGKVIIPFKSDEELEELIEKIEKSK